MTESDSKCKKLEKRYEHSKKKITDFENKLIEKNEKIKRMEMKKKNEDLCSKIENDFPQ